MGARNKLIYMYVNSTLPKTEPSFWFPSRVCPVQTRLRAAAKMRISRMVKPKSKRTDLNVDDWVKKEWETGNKNMLADLLTKANFDKDRARWL